ncbi:MAG: argininosuccinate lyase [Actinobacteria bacterium]|nr:argininosuccinate lyase [Actinomycetota bacterium]
MKSQSKIWSGRFSKQADEEMEKFSSSIHFDKKLFDADIRVNKEWALSLAKIGVYTHEEASRVVVTLQQIQAEYHAGKLSFAKSDEDIHSANERWLTERLGDVGAKIHTGRSRNDQVVTDLRIYLREKGAEFGQALLDLQSAFLDLAEKNITTVLPGQTHLRQAQPISLAHYLLSFFYQMQRDRKRHEQTVSCLNKCPLGSGAIAGAAFAIDRHDLAKRLGFDAPLENSYDATADRDFVNDVHHDCAQVMLHLSRLAEDFIIWSSEPFRYLEIDELYATGSSMMPQKKNPDSLELLRGKTARVIGNHVAGLTLMKGIPTAYVRDLQEDKEPLFDSVEQTWQSVRITTGVIKTIRINDEKMLASLDPALYATDLADYLVRKGIPFRKSHAIVGKIVAMAEAREASLTELSLNDYQSSSGLFEADLYELFDPVKSLERRNLYGGTGPASVRKQIKNAKELLKMG